MNSQIDVFVSFNSADRATVLELAQALREREVEAWIDEDRLRPGAQYSAKIQEAMKAAPCIAITFGGHGIGEWQTVEIDLSVQQSVSRKVTVIPVLLPGSSLDVVPAILSSRFAVSDLRAGISHKVEFDRLVLGITGKALSDVIASAAAGGEGESGAYGRQLIDLAAMGAIKHQLYRAAEATASEAIAHAIAADENHRSDVTRFLSLLIELRWRRGYLSAFERLFRVRHAEKTLRDYALTFSVPEGENPKGVLSACAEGQSVAISVGGVAVARTGSLAPSERADVIQALNCHGRLAASLSESQSFEDRLNDVPVRRMDVSGDEVSRTLYRNREALAVLAARHGMPGQETFLPTESAREPDIRSQSSLRPSAPGRYDNEITLRASKVLDLGELRELAEDEKWRKQIFESDKAIEAIRTIFGDKIDKDPQAAIREIRKTMQGIGTNRQQ
jgi:hypothetical protein